MVIKVGMLEVVLHSYGLVKQTVKKIEYIKIQKPTTTVYAYNLKSMNVPTYSYPSQSTCINKMHVYSYLFTVKTAQASLWQ
jgi:DNA polymerase III psi subunit